MNKKLMYAGGASVAALLVLSGIASTTMDTTRFLQSGGDSIIAKETILQQQVPSSQSTLPQAVSNAATAAPTAAPTLAPKGNLTKLINQVNNQITQVFPATSTRVESHIFTDKVVYRMSEVVFISVVVADPFAKTPLNISSKATNLENYHVYADIFDTYGNLVWTGDSYAENTQAAFSAKLPVQNLFTGQYLIRAYGNQVVPSIKQIRIIGEDFVGPQFSISYSTDQAFYFPGGTVTVFISVPSQAPNTSKQIIVDQTSDSEYQYYVDLDGTVGNGTLTSLYTANFTYTIPDDTVQGTFQIEVAIGLDDGSTAEVNVPVQVRTAQLSVIFYTQNNGPLVPNVTQTVYFVAYYGDDTVSNPFEVPASIYNASLLVNSSTNISVSPIVLQNGNISSSYKGVGSFNLTYNTSQIPYLKVYLATLNQTLQFRVLVTSYYYSASSEELTFGIQTRLVPSTSPVVVRVQTNALLNTSNTYVLTISQREKIVYSSLQTFAASSTTLISIPAANITVLNGATLQVNLYLLNQTYISWDNSTGNTTNITNQNITTVSSWLIAKGAATFYKFSTSGLQVNVQYDRATYIPGGKVNYKITVVNATTGKQLPQEVFINAAVVDNTALNGLQPSDYSTTFASKLDVENEFPFPGFDYVDELSIFDPAQTLVAQRLEAFLVSQAPRAEYTQLFFLQIIQQLSTEASQLPPEDFLSLQRFYGYTFGVGSSVYGLIVEDIDEVDSSYPSNVNDYNYGTYPIINNFQDYTQIPFDALLALGAQQQQVVNDNMNNLNISATKTWNHPQISNYQFGEESDLTQTVLYLAGVQTVNGSVSGSFYLNDAVTNYTLTVNSYSLNGSVGTNSSQIVTINPFTVTTTAPSVMTLGDNITIQAVVVNNFSSNLNATIVGVNNDASYGNINFYSTSVIVKPNTSVILNLTISPNTFADQSLYSVIVTGINSSANASYNQQFDFATSIIPNAAIIETFQSGVIATNQTGSTTIPQVSSKLTIALSGNSTVNQQFDVNAYFYPTQVAFIEGVIDDVFEKFDNLQNPQFNDMTEALYILAQSIPQLITINENLQDENVADNITNGLGLFKEIYQQLNSRFLMPDGGYEPFASGPSNEVATALALNQLGNLNAQLFGINTNQIQGLSKFILGRRSSTGIFLQNPAAGDILTRPSAIVASTYITYQLLNSSVIKANASTNLTNEVNAVFNAIKANLSTNATNRTSNQYLLALAVPILNAFNRTANASYLLPYLTAYQAADGSFSLNTSGTFQTVSNSGPRDSIVETTALAVATLAKNNSNVTGFNKSISYLQQQIQNGVFGGVQATLLSYSAMLNFSIPQPVGQADLTIYLNGVATADNYYDEEQDGLDGLAVDIQNPDQQEVDNYLTSVNTSANATINATIGIADYELYENDAGNYNDLFIGYWATATVFDTLSNSTATNSSLNLTVRPYYVNGTLGNVSYNGKNFSYNVTIKNTGNNTVNIVKIVVAPSSCLDPQVSQFAVLQNNGTIAGYDYQPNTNEVGMYFRGLTPASAKTGNFITFNVNFVQKFSGICKPRPFVGITPYDDRARVSVRPAF